MSSPGGARGAVRSGETDSAVEARAARRRRSQRIYQRLSATFFLAIFLVFLAFAAAVVWQVMPALERPGWL